MKTAKLISRIIVGIVFIFSGFVKAVDPMGTAIKFEDYFNAFGISFLIPYAMILAVLLCLAEFLTGCSILFNLKPKVGAWVATLLMLIFTPLTLVLALTNPVTDCGCFGDAIHLTNWQTFLKNVILLFPCIILLFSNKEILKDKHCARSWTLIGIIAFAFVCFMLYNIRHLPVIDFLPYKVGTYIPEKMIVPEGMPVDQYETTFIYEKDGVKKEFTINDYPADDDSWTFVDSKTKLVSKGYEPPIHDLSFVSENGKDKTDEILSSPNYTLFLISKKIDQAKKNQFERMLELGKEAKDLGIDFYLLTASVRDDVVSYFDDEDEPEQLFDSYETIDPYTYIDSIDMSLFVYNLPFEPYDKKDDFFLVDETTLKTMMRCNPGFMLIKNGIIYGKWSWADKFDLETINNFINNNF